MLLRAAVEMTGRARTDADVAGAAAAGVADATGVARTTIPGDAFYFGEGLKNKR